MLTDKEKELANRLGKAFAMDWEYYVSNPESPDPESQEFPNFYASNPLSLVYYEDKTEILIENVTIEFLKEMASGFEQNSKGIDVKEFWDSIWSISCWSIDESNDFSYLEQLLENNLVDLYSIENQIYWDDINTPAYLVENIITRAKGRAGIDFLKNHNFDLNKINWEHYINYFEKFGSEDIELLNTMKEIQATKESLVDKT